VDAPDRVLVDTAAEPGGEAPIDGARMAAALRAAAGPMAIAVALVTLLVLVVSLAAADRYRATARIVQSSPGPVAAGAGSDADQRGLATSLAFLTTPAVRAAAAQRVPGETAASLKDKVSAALESGANVIDVTATDRDPVRAAAIANAVADRFLAQRATAARAEIARTAGALRAQLTPRLPAEQAATMRARLGELSVQQANAGSDLQLAEVAQPPSSPYTPRPLRNAVVALLASALVAVLAVLVRERLRPRAGGARELGRLAGMPVLASLPGVQGPTTIDVPQRLAELSRRLPPAVQRPVDALATTLQQRHDDLEARAHTATDEAMHALLGAVLLELPPDRRHVLLVTSPHRDQGAAFVAAGLARLLAQAGQQTLALSADLTSPALAAELGVRPGPGLAQALARTASGDGTTVRLSAAPGLADVAVVPYGGPARDGVGLLRPGAVDALFAALDGAKYGFVVVEAPGLLTAPEARLIARHADAVLLACPERAPADHVADAREALERLGVPVLGVVATAGDGHATAAAPEPPPQLADAPAAAPNGSPDISERETRALVAHLRDAGRPLTTAELRGALGDPPATRLRAQLRRLIELGEVERGGTGVRGDPYVYGVREP
jgi:Mrp family chromosome partitioning ATPase/capsular polysaccharide biosynthesis protein